ncbi:Retinoblastoma-like protein 1 [Salvia divinorum]|uniref:RHOMBOID-like protein n=1 Tax=Salvia divinorum TaxID=28513 RepID=A0ABD1HTW0_SALDI
MGRTPIAPSPAPEAAIQIPTRRSEKPRRSRPPRPPPPEPSNWVTWLSPAIIFINIALFFVAMYLNNCPAHSHTCIGASFLGRFAFQGIHENPLLGPSAATLLDMGAMDVKKVVEGGEAWRLVTCMWLHAGIFHVLANMLSFVFVGFRMEQEFGFARLGAVYVISGIGGSLASSLYVRTTISVGASGALFGLLGAMLSELIINWSIYENKVQSLMSLVLIILINLAVGILPHVDNFAHLGGFLTGFMLGFVLMIRPQYGYINKKKMPDYIASSAKSKSKPKYKPSQCIMLIVALIILIIGFTSGLTLLLKGADGNDHCSWCHYLSCVPSPLWTCQARCASSQYENQLQLTCIQNRKSQIYMLSNGTTALPVQQLCAELCG